MEEKEFNYINAIPLVDVMLVLLAIVLTTATFITQGNIKVNLPTAKVKLEKEPTTIEFFLTKDKKMYVNDVEVTNDTISLHLSRFDKQNDVVQINADKSLTIDDLTNALALIQNSGFNKLSIKTEIVK